MASDSFSLSETMGHATTDNVIKDFFSFIGNDNVIKDTNNVNLTEMRYGLMTNHKMIWIHGYPYN